MTERRRDDKSDRWQQLVLGKLPPHCIGTCYFGKSSLGSLPANFGGALCPKITTYFLGRGPGGVAGNPRPFGHMECGYGQPIGFLRSKLALPLIAAELAPGFPIPEISSRFGSLSSLRSTPFTVGTIS